MKRDKISLLGEISCSHKIHTMTEKDTKQELICTILDAKYGSNWSAEPSDFKK